LGGYFGGWVLIGKGWFGVMFPSYVACPV